MVFTLIVCTNHLNHSQTALSFARSILTQNHTINCIFFLFDGTYNANQHIDLPSDEPNIAQAWSKFAQEHNLELNVCAASCYRRGINEQMFAPGFTLSSIGNIVDSCDNSDRVVRL